ncbi:putative RTA1 domain protein [Dendryphion nanum]|uniref:RTA1 domain protein n=1 Tax=Dendryphion nanum TaxID=256645 RepID=A0A9P9ELH5_9PLEO|nr:putative RTA1 domain protein [Dendryphion nanum]
MSTQHQATRGLADFDLYPYNPSAPIAWTFLVLFAIAGVVHLLFMIPLRAWSFIPLILGCAGEAGGYYGRAWSHNNIRLGSAYLIQLMLILASAPLIAATIYMTLGRIIRALDAEEHAVFSPRWTTKIYVVIDIGSFVCQMAGSAMQASGDAEGVKLGNNIVMGGLGFQLAAFAIFIVMAAVFHRRLNTEPTAHSRRPNVKWRRHLWNLYAVSVLVFVRSLFRLIEFAEGPESKLYKTEVYLYIFDAALMFLVVALMAIIHPGLLVRSVRKAEVMLSPDDNSTFLLRR